MFEGHESAHETKDPYFDLNVGLMRAVLLLHLARVYLSPLWGKSMLQILARTAGLWYLSEVISSLSCSPDRDSQ